MADLVRMADQRALTSMERRFCDDVSVWFQRLIDSRPTYLIDRGLQSDVYIPDGNWNLGKDFHDKTRVLLDTRRYEHLRMFATHFTGWPIFSFGESNTGLLPWSTPADVDRNLTNAKTWQAFVSAMDVLLERLPTYLHVSAPAVCGEIGVRHRGLIVSYDTIAYYERLALLFAAGFLNRESPDSLFDTRPLNIIEIGGGYGGLAYYLSRLLPHARYAIVDIPESLVYSAMYLGISLGGAATAVPVDVARPVLRVGNCDFIPNYCAREYLGREKNINLAINTLSMSEMTPVQVRDYCEILKESLVPRGLFFEQNQDNTHIGLQDAEQIVAELFPYGRSISQYVGGRAQGKANLWGLEPIQLRVVTPVALSDTYETNQPKPDADGNPPAIELLEESYLGYYNIIRAGKRYYAVPQDEGAFKTDKAERGDYPRTFIAGDVNRLKAITREGVDAGFGPRSTMLVEEGYKARFNIVRHSGAYYALAQDPGIFDPQVFTGYRGATLQEVKQQIP